MNKIFSVFLLVAVVVFQACEGPEGPIGPAGPEGVEGKPGINIVSEVFQVTASFTSANKYEAIFKLTPVIETGDVVMAFIEWEKSGQTPIWRALPQTVFFEQGILVYNYDFTQADFRLFLDGPLDYSLLGADWTQSQVFRVVIIPGDFVGARLDLTDYEAVTQMLGVTEEDFQNSKVTQDNK